MEILPRQGGRVQLATTRRPRNRVEWILGKQSIEREVRDSQCILESILWLHNFDKEQIFGSKVHEILGDRLSFHKWIRIICFLRITYFPLSSLSQRVTSFDLHSFVEEGLVAAGFVHDFTISL